MNTHRLQGRRVVFGGYGGALAAAVLALAVAACTRSMSLGAAGTPDGSDVRASTDAGDAPDLRDSAPDVAIDAPADRNTDATSVTASTTASPIRSATSSRAEPAPARCRASASATVRSEIAPESRAPTPRRRRRAELRRQRHHLPFRRRRAASRVSAELHLHRRHVGDSAAASPAPSMDPSSSIRYRSRPSPRAERSPPESRSSIDSRGSAQRTIPNPSMNVPTPPPPRSFPPGAPEVTRFLYHLQRVGDLTRLTVGVPGCCHRTRSQCACFPGAASPAATSIVRSESDARFARSRSGHPRAAGNRRQQQSQQRFDQRAGLHHHRRPDREQPLLHRRQQLPRQLRGRRLQLLADQPARRRHLRLPERRLLLAVGRLRRARERLHGRRGSDLQRQPGGQCVPRHLRHRGPLPLPHRLHDRRGQRQVLLTARRRRALRGCARLAATGAPAASPSAAASSSPGPSAPARTLAASRPRAGSRRPAPRCR